MNPIMRTYGVTSRNWRRQIVMIPGRLLIISCLVGGCLFCIPTVRAERTELLSVDSDGTQGNGDSTSPRVTPDGRYVVFESEATNLVANDIGNKDVFVRDRDTDSDGTFDQAGAVSTTRVNVTSSGLPASGGDSRSPQISNDGRYVVFESDATNLLSPTPDTNGQTDIFLRDRVTGQTERINVHSDGTPAAGGNSLAPAMSGDGRYVVYESLANNLADGDSDERDIFVYDRNTDSTVRIAVDANADPASEAILMPDISDDGRYLVFQSSVTDLVADDTNGQTDIFLHDRVAGQTERINVHSDGTPAPAGGDSLAPAVSGDGRYVVYESLANNLADGDSGERDIFVYDRNTDSTVRIAVDANADPASEAILMPDISDDGRYLVFESSVTDLVDDDINGVKDIFLYDRDSDGNGTYDESGGVSTVRVNVDSAGDPVSTGNSGSAHLSDDADDVVFESLATDLVAADTNGESDIFVRVTTPTPSASPGTPTGGSASGGCFIGAAGGDWTQIHRQFPWPFGLADFTTSDLR